jgi:hypothetical protein
MSETKTCYGCGKHLTYPRYYCKTCDAFYHWECLKGTGVFGSGEQCPYYHGYANLKRFDS